jgi:hypothetical protein
MQLKTLKREDYDEGIHEKIDIYNKYVNIVNLFGTSDQKQIIENDDSYQYVKNNDTYSLRYYIDRLNQTLRDTAIEAFLINNDVVQFLSSAAERKAALENLKKQRTAIDNYTRELETAVNIASSNIEQAVTSLIAEEFQKQVDLYEEETSSGIWLKWPWYKPGKDESQLQENIHFWYRKRKQALYYLTFYIFLMSIVMGFLILFAGDVYAKNSITILSFKLSIGAILYANYHFAQKNYRVYASLRNQYKHKLVNAKMLAGYMSVKDRDQALYQAMVDKVMGLLVQPVQDHNFKDSSDADSIARVVQNYTGIKSGS